MIVVEGLEWKHIYWIRGAISKNFKHRNAVTDPPTSGWQHAFIITGEKHSTIFCPYSLESHSVRNDLAEVALAKEPRTDFNLDTIVSMMRCKWEEFQGLGFQKNYDTCALVLRMLGQEVPAQVMTGGGEDTRKKGGKEVEASLLKPVKVTSKRGKFLKWFIDGGGSRPIREAMATFAMTRSNALSYLHMIHKDHGIGYDLMGDTASIIMPEGCVDPFNEKQPEPEVPGVLDTDDDDDDEDWLK
jgi:hypothetical protein